MDDFADILDDRNKKVSGQKRKIFGLVLACIAIAAAFLGITIWANVITRQTDVDNSGVTTTPEGKAVGTGKTVEAHKSIAKLASTPRGIKQIYENIEHIAFERSDGFKYRMIITDRKVHPSYTSIVLYGGPLNTINVTLMQIPNAEEAITIVQDATDPGRSASHFGGLRTTSACADARANTINLINDGSSFASVMQAAMVVQGISGCTGDKCSCTCAICAYFDGFSQS